MAQLTTDFIKIAQVGPSIDGRTIREDWLRDMADTYDPATYTAMLWPEHARWCGNLGEVLELRAAPDEKGVFSLFARLKPNASFLEWNAAGQGLFYSIEVEENFAKTGKTYLGGLGVTDSPASLGMQSTRFSARRNTIFIGNVPFEPLAPPSTGVGDQTAPASLPPGVLPAAEESAPGWFKRLFPSFFTSDNAGENPAQKDPRMAELDPRVDALEQSLAALTESVTDLAARIAALEVDAAATEGGQPANDEPAYKALARQFGALRKEFASLSAKLSASRPGTAAGVTTGPAQGAGIL